LKTYKGTEVNTGEYNGSLG